MAGAPTPTLSAVTAAISAAVTATPTTTFSTTALQPDIVLGASTYDETRVCSRPVRRASAFIATYCAYSLAWTSQRSEGASLHWLGHDRLERGATGHAAFVIRRVGLD